MLLRGKKGLSPVIATVMLVALVLVLAAIVFMWARGFIGEQVEKGGRSTESVCREVSFKLDFIEKPSDASKLKGDLYVSNTGNANINSLEVRAHKDGNADITVFDADVVIGGTDVVQISLDEKPDKLVIFPRILGQIKNKKINKAVTCLKVTEEIEL